MTFLPERKNAMVPVVLRTWWNLSPEVVQRFLAILGFEDASVSYSNQKHRDGEFRFFSVVAHRTVPM